MAMKRKGKRPVKRKPKARPKAKPKAKRAPKRKPKRKRPTRPRLPRGQGEGWKRRTHKRGYNARQILKGIDDQTTKSEVLTAIQLMKDDELSQSEFVNLVNSLGFNNHQAYTFFFSPP